MPRNGERKSARALILPKIRYKSVTMCAYGARTDDMLDALADAVEEPVELLVLCRERDGLLLAVGEGDGADRPFLRWPWVWS